MENFQNIIEQVRIVEPTLSAYGISDFKYEDHPIREKEFRLCVDYLQKEFENQRDKNLVSSYSLKHTVERWARELGDYEYIPNGTAIAAAIYLGYTYIKEPPNVILVFPGAILTVEGIKPSEEKVRKYFKEGDIVFQVYKIKSLKKHKYYVRVGKIIERDPMYMDMYDVAFPRKYRKKDIVEEYKLYSTEMGDTPEMAVKNNWCVILKSSLF